MRDIIILVFLLGAIFFVAASQYEKEPGLSCTLERATKTLGQLRCPLREGEVLWLNIYLEKLPEGTSLGDEIVLHRP